MTDNKSAQIQHLLSGLQGMGQGVLVLSGDGAVVFHNRAFLSIFSSLADEGSLLGMAYADVIGKIANNGEIAGKKILRDPAAWIQDHLGLIKLPPATTEEQLAGGGWIRIEAASTDDGGQVLTFTDVSGYKKDEMRLIDVIENTADGVALWDQTDRLVHCNQVFSDLYTVKGVGPIAGESYKAMITRVVQGMAFFIDEDEDIWIEKRMVARRQPISRLMMEHTSGKWFLMAERRARDGGIVTSLSDITQIKQKERELLLAVQDMDMVRIRMEEQTAEVTSMAEELHSAKEEADRASKAKTDFLSAMSHDLRTPLNAILGFGQLLKMDAEEDECAFNEEQREGIDQIIRAGEHLLELINEVLDLARIESGRTELEIEEVNAVELAEDAISLTQTMAKKRGIKVTPPLGQALPVMADQTRLRQIMVNLMSNAIKYNNEEGSVAVTVTAQPDGMVAIAVSDTGPGIAEDLQAGVFEPFNRAGAEKTQTEGRGIGLAIVKSLVEMMQGRIELKSVLGQGSIFTVFLPAVTMAGKAQTS